MPGIEIKEFDNTGKKAIDYSNFAVVVPGFVADESGFDAIADENSIYECSSQRDFEYNVGFVDKKCNHIGNQIAYSLLALGYTVLYKKITAEDEATLATELSSDLFWEPLIDRSAYNFRYIISGLDGKFNAPRVFINKKMAIVARHLNKTIDNQGRGDCIALLDLDEKEVNGSQSEVIAKIKEQINTSYGLDADINRNSAFFTPSIYYTQDSIEEIVGADHDYKNTKFPASFHYLACAAKTFNNYAEWYAVAGFDRGICDFEIEATEFKLGEAAVKALEPRYNDGKSGADIAKAVNPIINIRGNYYIWGNRTAEKLAGSEKENLKAWHFLNIRQLCTTIVKDLYLSCREFTFDPNSDVLWINFKARISPNLEKMKADQGITDYKPIKCVSENKAELRAKLRIVPIEAVEDFYINLYLEDSISGTTVEIEE